VILATAGHPLIPHVEPVMRDSTSHQRPMSCAPPVLQATMPPEVAPSFAINVLLALSLLMESAATLATRGPSPCRGLPNVQSVLQARTLPTRPVQPPPHVPSVMWESTKAILARPVAFPATVGTSPLEAARRLLAAGALLAPLQSRGPGLVLIVESALTAAPAQPAAGNAQKAMPVT